MGRGCAIALDVVDVDGVVDGHAADEHWRSPSGDEKVANSGRLRFCTPHSTTASETTRDSILLETRTFFVDVDGRHSRSTTIDQLSISVVAR